MRWCWVPALSARRSRCISSSAGSRVALVDRAGAGRGDLLRQCRHHRRQHDFSPGFSEPSRRAAAHRAQAGAGGELSSRVSAAGGALARVVSCLVAAAAAARDRACDAAVFCPRGRRARGADRGSRRRRGGAQDRLAQAVPPGPSFAATARERDLAATFGIATRVLDIDGARALEPSLEPVFRRAIFLPDVMSVTNPLALTRAYARRFAALGGVTLTGDARTLAPRRRALAHRDRGGDRRGAARRRRARPVVARCAGAARHPPAARDQARLSPAFPRATAMRRWRGRCSMPTAAIASRRWSRASASPPGPSSPRAMRRRRRCSSTG